MNDSRHTRDVSMLLQLAGKGDPEATDKLYGEIYDDLRDAARRTLRSSFRGDLQTTALVNESFLRFEKDGVLQRYAKNKRLFFAVAIRAMRNILVDHYRSRKQSLGRELQGSDYLSQTIDAIEKQTGVDFQELNDAMEELRKDNPRQYSAIMHRFFGGLTIAQTAEIMSISVGTVERDWRIARAKLMKRLK